MPDETKRSDEERIPDPTQRAAAYAVHAAIKAIVDAQYTVQIATGHAEPFALTLAAHVFNLWWVLISTAPWDGGPVEIERGVMIVRGDSPPSWQASPGTWHDPVAAIVADMKRQKATREPVVTARGEEVAERYDGIIGKVRGFKVGQEIEWHDPAFPRPRRGILVGVGTALGGDWLVSPYGKEPGTLDEAVPVSIVNVMTFADDPRAQARVR